MNSKNQITSHISGLFYRNLNLLAEGITPIYVFDGKPPELKLKEIEKRKENKEIAQEKYEQAKQEQDIDNMKKYSSQTVKITQQIIDDSKELLDVMGINIVQADSEGEAEAAMMANKNLVWASASQDYDSLLYGTPKLIRNLTLARKRKTPSGLLIDTKIELIEFENVLNKLQINKEQLICLAILAGTDYNPGGVRGIGQKRALEIVQKYQFPVKIFDYIQNSGKYIIDFNWQEVFKQFKEFKPVTNETPPEKKYDKEKLKEIMIIKHEFSKERIDTAIEKLEELEQAKKQKTMNDFF